LEAARVAEAKKGQAIMILEVGQITTMTDYFVLASADNRVQLRALADETAKRMRERGVRVRGREGYDDSGWILMDLGDVVVHYFLQEKREFYSLERLWGDAARVEFTA
jgi:ribosome-associated protein